MGKINRAQVLAVANEELGLVVDVDTQLSCEQAQEIMEYLEVDNPRERLEWFNCRWVDGADIERLANIDFSVHTCDVCGDEEYKGHNLDWAHFQGANQGEGGEVTIVDKEKYVCNHCLTTNPVFF